MNSLLPPSPDPDYQLTPGMDDVGNSAMKYRALKVLGALRRYWWVPALTSVLGLGAAAALVSMTPPSFVSRSKMWETIKMRLPEGSMFSEDVQTFIGTQTELLKSEALRQQALAKLKASTNSAAIPLAQDGQPVQVPIRVTGGTKSSVFMLEATGSNPAYIQQYLDALMMVYLDYKRNIRKVVSGDTLASITEQVQRTERDLKAEQDILLAFQKTNNMAILQQEGSVAGGYLTTLKTKLSDIQLENRLLQGAAAQPVTAPGATNASLEIIDAAVASDSTASAGAPAERQMAFKELEILKIQRARLSKYLKPKHPKIARLDADIERAEKLMDIFRRQNRDELAARLQANQMKAENITASIKEWESKVVEANSRIGEAERLKVNVQRIQTVYERLVLLVQNVGISRNIDQETLAILEPASVADRSRARETSMAAMAVLAGLSLGLGIVFLVALRDDRFNSVAEVSEKLGVVVGLVPDMPRLNGPESMALLEQDGEHHIYAESFRSLRSAILFLAIEGARPKILLITSAVPGEGKSTVVANLARTLAQGGSRVLLVDGDLRKGHLHDVLGMQRGPGFAELLHQSGSTASVIQTNGVSNLSFISRGDTVTNPGDLFLSPALDQILERWRKEFDYVLIDSSPVFAADDASTLAPKVDGTLFVVRNSFSRAGAVREALELLCQRQARLVGLVFNGADSKARSYRYYKYADYYAQPKPVNPAKTS